MLTDIDLKKRLQAWARCYAGAQFRRLGYSSTAAIKATPALDMAGLDTDADDIERIVRAMEECGRWRESRVLRAEFYLAGVPEAERLSRLSQIGLRMSRAAYYNSLSAARAFVLGALSQRMAA